MDPCEYDPMKTPGSVGMHHCPYCGEMVVAGIPHPPYWDDLPLPPPPDDDDDLPFP
jgi:hypothetical protein